MMKPFDLYQKHLILALKKFNPNLDKIDFYFSYKIVIFSLKSQSLRITILPIIK